VTAHENDGVPPEFAAASAELAAGPMRSDLRVRSITSPTGIAPYSVAFAAEVLPLDADDTSAHGAGRFVYLYDPEGQDGWGGTSRVVCFAQAPLEGDISTDPFLADVAWSWLTDALASREVEYSRASGTATRILAKGFGELAGEQDTAHVELRASWSPAPGHIGGHIEAWGELLAMLAGLPPREGATSLDARRRERG
jgi:hypothetical protein